MKKLKLAVLATALIVLSSSVMGCNFFGGQGEESSSLPESSSSPQLSSAPLEPSSSEAPSSSSELPSSSQTGEVVNTIETDDKEFNKLFAGNSIDKAYKDGQCDAFSNVDMIDVANKFSEIWQKEIDSAYKRLLAAASGAEKDKFKAEQEKWVEDTPEALRKISETAAATGGSLSQVIEAGDVMEYYRARAAAVYRELYPYEKALNLEYQG